MSEEENSQKKAQSVIVDFYVIFRKFEGVSAAGLLASAAILISLYFLLAYNPFGDHELPASAKIGLATLIGAGVFTAGSLGWIVIWVFTRGRKTHKNLLEIHSSFIHRSYVTTFELVRPQGDTKIDRLFNHLSLVFPEVERIKKRLDKKNKKFSDVKLINLVYRNYNKAFITDTGLFLIKIFEKKVTVEDIESVIKELNIHQKIAKASSNHIMRVICLAEKFDTSFENIDYEKFPKRDYYKIDLISEDEFGYSTIWIDR